MSTLGKDVQSAASKLPSCLLNPAQAPHVSRSERMLMHCKVVGERRLETWHQYDLPHSPWAGQDMASFPRGRADVELGQAERLGASSQLWASGWGPKRRNRTRRCSSLREADNQHSVSKARCRLWKDRTYRKRSSWIFPLPFHRQPDMVHSSHRMCSPFLRNRTDNRCRQSSLRNPDH